MTIHVIEPGLLTTVQDAGRFGYAHLGISPAGAADDVALRLANRLVGNEEGAAALEMTLVGATLEFDEACAAALAGGECDATLDGAAAGMWETIDVKAGAVLRCGPMRRGARAYLAVRGGFEVGAVLGSASTNLSGKFGGVEGRALKKGDVLCLRRRTGGGSDAAKKRLRKLKAGVVQELYGARGGTLRVTRGLQADWFRAEERAKFLSGAYRVSEESNRSGLRLKGEALRAREGMQLITEGVAAGAVQVPPDGEPIILFVDQQTTGGYPKIANVIAADLHRVGQLRPRDEVRFAEVTIPEAVRLLREREELLERSFAE
jgi:antagonist of KipI